jgi:hypothetical protein
MFGCSFAECGPFAAAAGGLAPGPAISAGPAVRVAVGLLSCATTGAANSPVCAARWLAPAGPRRWLGWKASGRPSGCWIAGGAGTPAGRICGAADVCMTPLPGSNGGGMSTSGIAASAGVAMLCNAVSGNGSSRAGGTPSTTAGGSAASSAATGRAGSASAGLAGSTAGMAEPAAPATGGPTSNSGALPRRVPPASATGKAGAAAESGAIITPAWSGPGTPAPAGAPPAPQPGAPTSTFPSACAKPVAVPPVPPGTAPTPRGGAVIGKVSSVSMIGSGPPARHGPAE